MQGLSFKFKKNAYLILWATVFKYQEVNLGTALFSYKRYFLKSIAQFPIS